MYDFAQRHLCGANIWKYPDCILIKFILQPFCHRLWKMCYQLANEAVVVAGGMLVVAACERKMTLFFTAKCGRHYELLYKFA
jgi:hypothetical protein